MLTEKEVREEIDKIQEISKDDEAAHSLEDSLHQRVLKAIANDDCENPRACARAALETLAISFARWCA